MSNYYGSGLPYSDYIMHYGIKGQKWYNRRYQYDDGTLTPAGKERYRKGGGLDRVKESRVVNGAKAVGKVLGKGASRIGQGFERAIKGKLAEKVPWMLNDEELERYRYRAERENAFRKTSSDRATINKNKESDTSKWAKQLARDVAGSTVKTLASKGVNEWAEDHIKSKSKRKAEKREDRIQELNDAHNLAKQEWERMKWNKENRNNQDEIDEANLRNEQIRDRAEADRLQEQLNNIYNQASSYYSQRYKPEYDSNGRITDYKVRTDADAISEDAYDRATNNLINRGREYTEQLSAVNDRINTRQNELTRRQAYSNSKGNKGGRQYNSPSDIPDTIVNDIASIGNMTMDDARDYAWNHLFNTK